MKVGLAIAAGVVAASAIACAPTRTITEGVADTAVPPIVAPLAPDQRMTVGIARFTNESTFGSGLFTDAEGDRLGKQASDLLANRLMQTQHFNVVERQDIGRVQAEAKLMGLSEEQFRAHLLGVDALIMGSVVELGRETTAKTWLLGRTKTQRARARVVLRLVDPRTGAVFYTAEGTGDATLETTATLGFGGTAGWDSTLDGKAIDAAIVNMMNNVVRSLDSYQPRPVQAS